MDKEFWVIMIDGNFLNENLFRGNNTDIIEAMKFCDEEECKSFIDKLRKDKYFKAVKVTCKLEEVSS